MKFTTAVKALSFIFTLLLLIVVAPIAFILLTDANDFKPHLQKLAQEQGVQLNISGDLNWRIYPDIELEVSDIALVNEQSEGGFALNANLGLAKLQVELRPLFSGELRIRGIEVSDGQLSIRERTPVERDIESGSGNEVSNVSSEGSPMVSIDLIKLQKLHFEYMGINNVATEFKINELGINQLNLSGESFPINLSLSYKDDEQELAIYTEAQISIDLEKQNYKLSTEQLAVDLDMDQPIAVTAGLDAALNRISNQWSLTLTEAKLNDLAIKANASGSVEPMSALGKIELSDGSQFVSQLSGQSLIEKLSVRTNFDYSPERFRFNEFVAEINESKIASSIEYDLTGNSRSSVNVDIDQIDLDKYLTGNPGSQDDELNSQTENPLIFLEDIPATTIVLNVGSLASGGQTITNIETILAIDSGEADIQLASATLAEGILKGALLVRASEQPQVVVSGFTASQINLASLTLDESGKPFLQGIANLGFSGDIQTVSGDSAVKELNGSGQLDVSDLLLADINIEQSICASAQRLGASAALTEQWASGTRFDQMSSPYDINSGVLVLNQIGTGFGNLKLAGASKLDLDSMNFDADFSLRINGERTSEQGCSINKYLRDTALPLSCEGNLSEGGETSCGLNSSFIGDLLKGQLKGEIGRQLNRLLGGGKAETAADETDNEASGETIEQESSEQVKDAVKGLLEGLFK